MMQTRNKLLGIHVQFLYWKTQNFSENITVFLWKGVQNIMIVHEK